MNDRQREALEVAIAATILEYEATDTDTGEPRALDEEDATLLAQRIMEMIY